ncbi:hypothetical protein OLK001_26580 [Synechocystis sp. LKSZ1]
MQYTIISLSDETFLCENIDTGERIAFPKKNFRQKIPIVGKTYVFEIRGNNIKIVPLDET